MNACPFRGASRQSSTLSARCAYSTALLWLGGRRDVLDVLPGWCASGMARHGFDHIGGDKLWRYIRHASLFWESASARVAL
jgi:hypothetical protein